VGESAKIRDAVAPYLDGKDVLDLGCGDEKIVSWAVGVDDASAWKSPPAAIDVRLPIDAVPGKLAGDLLGSGRPLKYDVVFSSHALEHLRSPIMRVILDWLSLVKVNGRLILYVPDENRYQFNPSNVMVHNPDHLHFLTSDVMRLCFNDIAVRGLAAVEKFEERNPSTGHPGEYSILIVARRIS